MRQYDNVEIVSSEFIAARKMNEQGTGVGRDPSQW